jgi:hypothetical protein
VVDQTLVIPLLRGLTRTLGIPWWKRCRSVRLRIWGPCVVRGPVDGRFLVWWVIDNVVWTDSWLSIEGACYGLTRVGASEEQARRQVGFVRGTRWPVGSSADRMVAWTARWSRGRFLGRASKPRSSRDYVGDKSWVEIGGGYTESARFAVVHQKTTRLLGWATKPRLKTRRGGAATQAGSTAQEGRSYRLGPVRLPGPVQPPRGAVWPPWPPAPRCFEAEDTCRGRKACVEAKQVAVAGHPSDEDILKTSKSALEGLVSLVIRWG